MPTDKCSPHPSLRKLLLQQRETLRENHKPSNFRVVELSPNRHNYNTTQNSVITVKRGGRKTVRVRTTRTLLDTVSPKNVRNHTRKFNHRVCLNMTRTRKTPTVTLMWKGESSRSLSPRQRTTVN